MKIKTVLQSTRPSFLVLSPVCVFLGLSTSLTTGVAVDYLLFSLIMTAALCAHISVNTINEYFDFKSGLDLKTEKTPFSGGSGALPDNPDMAKVVLSVGILSLIITISIGAYIIMEQGIIILPIGIVGVVLIVTYTQWLNRIPLLCLIAPGLGFGVLMVAGTHVLITGEHTTLPWLVSLIPFFLVNNLLLLNQYPDMKADASVGRKTFPIVFGVSKSNFIYAAFFLTSYFLILIYIIAGMIPKLAVITLLPMIFSLYALSGAIKYSSDIADFPQYLGANVAASILTPLLLGVTIII